MTQQIQFAAWATFTICLFAFLGCDGGGKSSQSPSSSKPAKSSSKTAARSASNRPANIPPGAHVNDALQFFYVPPDGFEVEGGFPRPVVARFKEKVDDDKTIENRVVIMREEMEPGTTLQEAFDTLMADIKRQPKYKYYESGDTTLGVTPCKHLRYKGGLLLDYHQFMIVEGNVLWMALYVGSSPRPEEHREVLERSARSFRTFQMAREEAEKQAVGTAPATAPEAK